MDRDLAHEAPSPTMSAALGRGRVTHTHQSLRSWWGLAAFYAIAASGCSILTFAATTRQRLAEHLHRQRQVIFGAIAGRRVLEDRFAEARRSASLMLRRMRAAKTAPDSTARCCRGSCRGIFRSRSTSWASRVFASYRHRTMPVTRSCGLMRLPTRAVVSSSLLRPCRARKCGCKRDEHLVGGGQGVERQGRRATGRSPSARSRTLASSAWPADRAGSLRGRRRRPARPPRRRG